MRRHMQASLLFVSIKQARRQRAKDAVETVNCSDHTELTSALHPWLRCEYARLSLHSIGWPNNLFVHCCIGSLALHPNVAPLVNSPTCALVRLITMTGHKRGFKSGDRPLHSYASSLILTRCPCSCLLLHHTFQHDEEVTVNSLTTLVCCPTW